MKIYHKKYFVWGIIFLLPLPLFAFGAVEADWWQWALSIGLSAKFLCAGLSRREGERQENIEKNYRRVSRELFGRYAPIKTNLPWFIAGGFFAAALAVRYLLDVVIPVWIAACFVVVLAVSVFYSIGLDREITARIDQEAASGEGEGGA